MDTDDAKDFIIARRAPGKATLVATWADGYEWAVIGTFAEQLEDKAEGTLFKGESLPQNYLFEPPFGQRLCCNF